MIRDDQGNEVDIRVHEHSRLYRALTSAWHTSIVHKSAAVGNVTSSSDVYLAQQYHDETVRSLQESRGDLREMQSIFNEFADECFLDLKLKRIAIHSREIFSIASKSIRKCCGKLTKSERLNSNPNSNHYPRSI